MTYKNPNSFKRALDDRLKQRARVSGQDFTRLRQLLIFERFLARVYLAHPGAIQLKGGMLMELRLRQTAQAHARMTKDIDVRLTGDFEYMVNTLKQHCVVEGEDFMRFVLNKISTITALEQNPNVYDGYTFGIQCTIANKNYGNPFKIDVAVADGFIGPPDVIEGDRFLDFCNITPVKHHVYPVEMHLAEKLHALTLPRQGTRENSRLKDLVDMGLLIQTQDVDVVRLRQSVEATFTHRDTHKLPSAFIDVPQSWRTRYDKAKAKDNLPWQTFEELYEVCHAFFNKL